MRMNQVNRVKDWSHPHIGQVVLILSGRYSGQYAIIVRIIDQRYVMIADGRKRRFLRSKKKNLLHLQLEPMIDQEIAQSLKENNGVTNGKLRETISTFVQHKQAKAREKGE